MARWVDLKSDDLGLNLDLLLISFWQLDLPEPQHPHLKKKGMMIEHVLQVEERFKHVDV